MQEIMKDYPLVITKKVAWGHMDAFAHVNNTVYFRYFEDIRMEFFETAGAMEHMKKTRIGPILASTRCDFRTPLEHPDTINIGTRIEDLKEKRFTMKYIIYSEAKDKIAAEGEGLVVYVDYSKGQSCPVPEPMVAVIKLLEQGEEPTL